MTDTSKPGHLNEGLLVPEVGKLLLEDLKDHPHYIQLLTTEGYNLGGHMLVAVVEILRRRGLITEQGLEILKREGL